ncbi:MAG TPA: hypothetical protein VFB61_09720 [Gemmatimonadales bacterium]|nr:hypothetical protein [Gemmatimonadales bacterium]
MGAAAVPIAGAAIGAIGSYFSNRSAANAANQGPIFPQDVRAPRDQLSAIFTQMLGQGGSWGTQGTPEEIKALQDQIRALSQPAQQQQPISFQDYQAQHPGASQQQYNQYVFQLQADNNASRPNAATGQQIMALQQRLNQLMQPVFHAGTGTGHGWEFGPTPFPTTLDEGGDPFAAVNRYRTASDPLFRDELSRSLDTEKSKLGGQYGIRFGTDLERGLGDTIRQTTNAREAQLGALGISAYDTYMQRRMADLDRQLGDFRSSQVGFLPLITNYLNGQPSSQASGFSGTGFGLQSLGGTLSNYPIFQYLSRLGQQGNPNGGWYMGTGGQYAPAGQVM